MTCEQHYKRTFTFRYRSLMSFGLTKANDNEPHFFFPSAAGRTKSGKLITEINDTTLPPWSEVGYRLSIFMLTQLHMRWLDDPDTILADMHGTKNRAFYCKHKAHEWRTNVIEHLYVQALGSKRAAASHTVLEMQILDLALSASDSTSDSESWEEG